MPVLDREVQVVRPRVTPEQKQFAQNVGGRLRALRVKAGLERPQLAERAGVKVSLIRDTEQGHSRLTLDNAAKISKALGVTIDDLLRGPRMLTPERGRPEKDTDDE